jgi:hypothetical protein
MPLGDKGEQHNILYFMDLCPFSHRVKIITIVPPSGFLEMGWNREGASSVSFFLETD